MVDGWDVGWLMPKRTLPFLGLSVQIPSLQPLGPSSTLSPDTQQAESETHGR